MSLDSALRHSLGLSDCSDEAPPIVPSLSADLDCFGAAATVAAAGNDRPHNAADAPPGEPPAPQGVADAATPGWTGLTTSRAPAALPRDVLPLIGVRNGARAAQGCRATPRGGWAQVSSIVRPQARTRWVSSQARPLHVRAPLKCTRGHVKPPSPCTRTVVEAAWTNTVGWKLCRRARGASLARQPAPAVGVGREHRRAPGDEAGGDADQAAVQSGGCASVAYERRSLTGRVEAGQHAEVRVLPAPGDALSTAV